MSDEPKTLAEKFRYAATDPKAWHARLSIEVMAVGAALLIMFFQHAPGWALTLAFLVATRTSLVGFRADLSSLQRTIERAQEEGQCEKKEEASLNDSSGT